MAQHLACCSTCAAQPPGASACGRQGWNVRGSGSEYKAGDRVFPRAEKAGARCAKVPVQGACQKARQSNTFKASAATGGRSSWGARPVLGRGAPYKASLPRTRHTSPGAQLPQPRASEDREEQADEHAQKETSGHLQRGPGQGAPQMVGAQRRAPGSEAATPSSRKGCICLRGAGRGAARPPGEACGPAPPSASAPP